MKFSQDVLNKKALDSLASFLKTTIEIFDKRDVSKYEIRAFLCGWSVAMLDEKYTKKQVVTASNFALNDLLSYFPTFLRKQKIK